MRAYPNGGGSGGRSLFSRIRAFGTHLRALLSGERCATAEWDRTADQTLSVAIFYAEGLREAAEIVREYAEYAVAEAFGDDYRIDVYVAHPVPAEIDNLDDFIKHVRAEYGNVADVHHFVAERGQHMGVDGWSMTSKHDVHDAKTDCLQPKNAGRHFEDVNYSIHEIGHGLGMGHRDHTDKTDDGYIPPMASGYVDGSTYIHEYHEDSIKKSNY